jgi:hypothetical protein
MENSNLERLPLAANIAANICLAVAPLSELSTPMYTISQLD